MIGHSIRNYQILGKLNEGGMGAVYKAVDTVLDREVAIKVLKPELSRQSTVIERFRTEALTLAKLNHPNIATLHSFFEQENEFFMVMEFVSGETLDKILEKSGAFSCDEMITLFGELLDAIDHAHNFGVVHRDIKPSNIMLTDGGALKILDFGIARFHGRARITRVGNVLGTLEYMSPEQAKGEETDVRSDVYSLGMTLYEILTGKTPFETENDFELIQKQIKETPIEPRLLNPEISEAVEAVIVKSYSKDPDERFQSAEEFRLALFEAHQPLFGTEPSLSNSIPKKYAAGPAAFGAPPTSFLATTFSETFVDSPEMPTVEIDGEEFSSAGELNSEAESNEAEQPLPLENWLSPNEISESTAQGERTFAVAAVCILLVLLGAAAWIFTANEKTRQATEIGQNRAEAENQAITQIKPQVKEEKIEIPAAQIDSPEQTKSYIPAQMPERAKISPASLKRTSNVAAAKSRNTRKKEARASEAALLRQAERLLTGN